MPCFCKRLRIDRVSRLRLEDEDGADAETADGIGSVGCEIRVDNSEDTTGSATSAGFTSSDSVGKTTVEVVGVCN